MAVLATYRPRSHTFGLRKVNLYDPSLTEFVPLHHQDRIRDIKHSNSMVLSTGDDKTLKLTSMIKNTVVQSYQLDAPCFSCAFDNKTGTALYCGTAHGDLMIFDVRYTKGSLYQLKKPTMTSPISSIHTVGTSIICSDSHSVYSWTPDSDGQYAYHPLPFDSSSQPTQLFSTHLLDHTLCTTALDNQQKNRLYLSELIPGLDGYTNTVHWTSELSIDPFACSHFKQHGTVYICYTKGNWVRRKKERHWLIIH